MRLRRVAWAAGPLAIALLAGAALWLVMDDEPRRVGALPPDEPSRGLIYDGLRRAPDTSPCRGGFVGIVTGRCTHGPDPTPAGVDITTPARLSIDFRDPPPLIQCEGDGTSGKRVQVIYARASDDSDRYSEFSNSIRQWAADADKVFRDSAAETGGERRLRFVHTPGCIVDVERVTLSATGEDNLDNTVDELLADGYDRADRKYMVFVDARPSRYCGIGSIAPDESPSSSNDNNAGPTFGRTDPACWSGEVPAHELMHNLGGVQLSAQNSSNGWHCVDEYDRMCYRDEPNHPQMQYLCPDIARDRLFDCNHDDYYDTSPPSGSYLDTHWNAANSVFLASSSQSLWGYVLADQPTTASYTPGTTKQRNSTGAKSSIDRTAVGAYRVTFTNLAFALGTKGGTFDVTAYGSGPETCKVASWSKSLADLEVDVRCLDAAGAPADTQFAAAYARPMSAPRFGYVWANQPTAASYTPSASYQFNSSGGTNTITRTGTGTYEVHLPGLDGPGGTAKVTAYGTGVENCKLINWTATATEEIVRVWCSSPAGAQVDTRFLLTFSGATVLFGTLTDPTSQRAYVWADQSTSASYTPNVIFQFNSSGATNTVVRSSAGVYQARLPGLAVSRGHVQVTAYGLVGGLRGTLDPARCKVVSWAASGSDELVNVRCFNASGTPADARFVLNFVD